MRTIALRLHVDKSRVRQALHVAGLPASLRHVPPASSELDDNHWLLARRVEGWSLQRIADHLHTTRKRVRDAVRDARLPIPLPRCRFPQLYDVAWIRARLRAQTMTAIGRELGCSVRSVRDAARRAGLPLRRQPVRPNDLEDARWLRIKLAAKPAASVAREMGCHPNTVSRAARSHGLQLPSWPPIRFHQLHDPDWLEEHDEQLAVEIACQLGCSVAAVEAARRRARRRP